MMSRRGAIAVLAAVVLISVAGCTAAPPGEPAPIPSATSSASATPTPSAGPVGPLQPIGTPKVLASGLVTPWSILRLDSERTAADDDGDASTLISERDTGMIKELTATGTLRVRRHGCRCGAGWRGRLPGAGGPRRRRQALALRLPDRGDETGSCDGAPARRPRLGPPQVILSGLAKAGNHNGGRIASAPTGMLYATVGDAGRRRAQDKSALNGKILRMTPTGEVPDGNPFAGSLV